jgi:hypothetical protein
MPAGLSGGLHTRLLPAEALGAIRDCERRYIALNKMQPAGVNWRALLQSSPIRGTSRIGAFGVDLVRFNQEALHKALSRPQNEQRVSQRAFTQYA